MKSNLVTPYKCLKTGLDLKVCESIYRADLMMGTNGELYAIITTHPMDTTEFDGYFPLVCQRYFTNSSADYEVVVLDPAHAAYFTPKMHGIIDDMNNTTYNRLPHAINDRLMIMPECGRIECGCSTGIHEGITFGSGKLDSLGYWEVPCAVCARAYEKSTGYKQAWPFSEETITSSREG